MLLILYGATAQMGHKSREYLAAKGFELVEKCCYCDGTPQIEARHGKRNYVSKQEFFDKTDSLFRYEFGGVQIGFEWSQITDALYSAENGEKKNKLLTLSTENIEIIRKIKSVYPDDVKIIYCYIDTVCLESLYMKFPDMQAKEYGIRMATGKTVKECYANNADVFDYTVIYGGESSAFNLESLFRQFDAIVSSFMSSEKEEEQEKYDIFISYAGEQVGFVRDLLERLTASGIKTFSSYYLKTGADFLKSIEQSIRNSKVFVPVFSEKAMQSEFFLSELKTAIDSSNNCGTVIYPIAFDYENLDWDTYNNFLELKNITPYRVNKNDYSGSINFIDDWFSFMFSSEKALMELSAKVEEYTAAELYREAKDSQSSYISMLQNHMSVWRKSDDNLLVRALIKYGNLLLNTTDLAKAESTVKKILSLITDKNFRMFNKMLEEFLILFFAVTDNTEAAENIIKEHLLCSEENKNALLSGIKSAKSIDDKKTSVIKSPLADKIAAYSKASLELFEAMFEEGIAPGYKETLADAYDRILGYCKTVNLGNEVSAACIDKISELKKQNELQDFSEEGKNILKSLKVYLGQALPETGKFDVFISHKSADDAVATKVYEYLESCGRVVFCDHFTLKEMHDSEYDKRITEALENSKHLVLVATQTEYLKSEWVYNEWHRFYNEKRAGRISGNLILVLSDNLLKSMHDLPPELRDGIEIIKTSQFRERINDYLW